MPDIQRSDGRCRLLVVEGGFRPKLCSVKLREERLALTRRQNNSVISAEQICFQYHYFGNRSASLVLHFLIHKMEMDWMVPSGLCLLLPFYLLLAGDTLSSALTVLGQILARVKGLPKVLDQLGPTPAGRGWIFCGPHPLAPSCGSGILLVTTSHCCWGSSRPLSWHSLGKGQPCLFHSLYLYNKKLKF